MVATRWLLLGVNPQMSKKLPRVKLKLVPHKKTLKLMLVHVFCKDFLAHLRHHIFCDME
jgi:hypothetical protein